MSLPKSVVAVADVCGFPAALALVKRWGGRRLKVPKGAVQGAVRAELVALMGDEAAEKFMAHYGGEEIPVPFCEAALRAERDAAIIADYDGGMSVPDLVEKYRLTERQIRTILNRTPGAKVDGLSSPAAKDDSQMALF